MSTPHNDQALGKPLRSKKKRSAVFIVIVASIAVHILAGLGLAAIKIIEVLQLEPEFEAPPVVATKPPPPPPPPPPTTKRSQRSLPRPQPLAARNPQNMSVPAIEISNSDLSIGGGRGFGGGLGSLGGAVADSLRITNFGYDQALEGSLKGTLYDFKRNPKGKVIGGDTHSRYVKSIRNLQVRTLPSKFFKAEKNLYISYLVMPRVKAELGPRSFGVEKTVKANYIGVHYSGSYKPVKSGKSRWLGFGDNVIMVMFNGRFVLDASCGMGGKQSSWPGRGKRVSKSYFDSNSGPMQLIIGDWFNLREGAETDVEIMIGELGGGLSGAYLLIEEEGVAGLKIFSTRPLSPQDKKHLLGVHPDAAQFI
jgi:hypothetical protein